MKLEVGMYCFNKTNRKLGIGEIISFQSNNNVNVKYKNDIELVSIGNIKASYNIIDLIEVGDYVNGCFVLEKDTKFIVVNGLDNYGFGQGVIPIEDIKSIVTKEQFESMQYTIQ